MDINTILRDEVLRRNILWYSLLNRHLEPISGVFRDANRRIERMILEGDSLSISDLKRKEILAKVREARRIFDEAVLSAVPMIELAANESGQAAVAFWNRILLRNLPSSMTATIGLGLVNPELVVGIGRRVVLGMTPSAWGNKARRDFARQALLELMTAQGFGETVHQAARRLTSITKPHGLAEKLGRQAAIRMARTAFIAASATVERAWVQRNRDILKGEKFLATLDSRTCQVCGGLDGTFYELDDPRPSVPVHGSCRCVYVPVTKSWRELGLDRDDLDPQFRSSMDGQVPGTMTYDDWIRSLPPDRVRGILGPSRYDIWMQRGQPPIGDFTDGGRILSLDELL